MEGKLNYKPRGDRVIVKRFEIAKPEAGQVVMPASQQKPLNEGLVMAVGPKIHDLQRGDHVCFVEYAGNDIEIDGESYLSMRDDEIVGHRLFAQGPAVSRFDAK